jgi:diguanylate cyclase (GGDEF)-like protein
LPTPPHLSWKRPYKILMRFLFGRVEFAQREEDKEFRYKLLIVLMTSGALVTCLFILGTLSAVNPISPMHQTSMLAFTSITTLLWLLLRGHPKRFIQVAWAYECMSLWESTSALIYVPSDELRLLWLFINVPGVFILLGRRSGWIITLGTMLGLGLGNAHLDKPYSPNALATAQFSLLYLGIFFHSYVGRTFSYFQRMRDYNDRLQDMASHDPLTHVLNARAYYEACAQQIALSQRTQNPFSVLFVDLDHFKKINDTHGHAAGDEVLRTIAQTLSQHLRQSDLMGRIGGEEFSVFLPNTSLSGALLVAENLRSAIERCRSDLGETTLQITASIGVASSTNGAQSMQQIQQHADTAMYEAKKAGRNRVSTLQPSNGVR